MDMHHSIIQQSINPLIQSPTPSILASFPGRRLDQFPELRILLQRFVLLHLESRAEEKIFERVPAENAMHHQAQLVALASVLALRPAYLVLDEPTSQLDPQGTQLAGEAFARLTRSGEVGILLVEHKTDLLERLADRVAVLAEGELVAVGPAAGVLADERLEAWGVDPPARVRLARAAERAGVQLPVSAA